MESSSKKITKIVFVITFITVLFVPIHSIAQNTDVKAIQERLKQQLQKDKLPPKVFECPRCGTKLEIDVEKREFRCPNSNCKSVYPKDHKCEKYGCALITQSKLDSNFVKLSITNRCVTMNTFRYVVVNSRGVSLAAGELDSPGVFEKVVPIQCKVIIYSIPNQSLQPKVGRNIIIDKQ